MQPLSIPNWQLYGERAIFPDILHIERIVDRAAGLDWTIAAHRHPRLHQMFLLLSGDVHMELEGLNLHVTAQEVVNVPRGAVHEFAFTAGTEGYVLTLPADDLPEVFDPTTETGRALARSFHVAATPEMIRRFDSLFAAYPVFSPFRSSFLRAEAAALIAIVLASTPPTDARSPKGDPRIDQFAAQIMADIHQRRSLADFASILAISPRHLSRLCKAKTGLNAQAFVDTLKMREASRLLVYTRMSVQEVGYRLGFDDPSYFSRVFQRNLGVSPREYRTRFEKQAAGFVAPANG